MILTHGSLSTGIGGFDIGAEENGIKTLWTCEIDPLRKDILKYKFPKAKHYGDMRKVTNPKYVDIISFGFPCQDISRANPKGKGIKGKRSGLWFEGWRIIRAVRPEVIVIENSPDLIHKGLTTILGQLAKSGYDAEWQVISCKRFGLPHIRKRLFVIAYSKKIGMDPKQIQRCGTAKKYRAQEMEAGPVSEGGARSLPVWSGSGRIHSTEFWTEMLSEFHRMDHGIPFNIHNGLVAAAGDTVSPLITSWIFSRIKEAVTR